MKSSLLFKNSAWLLMIMGAAGCGPGTQQGAKDSQSVRKLGELYKAFEWYSREQDGAMPARLGILLAEMNFGTKNTHGEYWITGYSTEEKYYEPSGLFYFYYEDFPHKDRLPLLSSYKVHSEGNEVLMLWTDGNITFEPMGRFDLLVKEYHMKGVDGNFLNPDPWPMKTKDGKLIRD